MGDALFNNGFNYYQYFASGASLIAQSILAGFPIFSTVSGIWFNPITQVGIHALGPIHGYVFVDLIQVICAYVAMYFFLRVFGISRRAAIASASIYIFSGQLMSWVELPYFTSCYLVLPAVFLCIEKAHRSSAIRKLAWSVGAGIFLAWSWLSGHPQYVIYTHILLSVYWIIREWSVFRTHQTRVRAWILISFVCVMVISYIGGYPQIQSILHANTSSSRSTGLQLTDYWSDALYPQDIIHFFSPFFHIQGVPFSGLNLYIGILPLVLLVCGFMLRKKIIAATNNSTVIHFFSYTFLFSFVYSFKYSPVAYLFYYAPLFSAFRNVSRMMFLGEFATAILLAFTIDYLITHKEEVRLSCTRILQWGRRIFFYVMLPVSAAITVVYAFYTDRVALYIWEYFIHHRSAPLSFPSEHYLTLIRSYVVENLGQVILYHKEMIILTFFLIATYLLFVTWERLTTKALANSIIILTLANFVAVYATHFSAIPLSVYTNTPQSVTSIRALADAQARVYTVLPGQTIYSALNAECSTSSGSISPYENFLLASELLLPSRNMDFNLDVLSGNENFMPVYLSHILGYIGAEQSVTGSVVVSDKLPVQEKVQLISSRKNVLRAENTRFIISHYPISDPDYVLKRSWHVGDCNTQINLYELKGYWPRYFLADTYVRLQSATSSDFASFIEWTSSNASPFVALTEDVVLVEMSMNSSTAKIVPITPEYGPATMHFSLDVRTPKLLYIGNAFWPGYHAYLDNTPVHIYRANHAHMAVFIPTGKHSLRLEFSHPSAFSI